MQLHVALMLNFTQRMAFRFLSINLCVSSHPFIQLALMLNFTRRMAFGFLQRGNQSMGYLSDYAVRYIEENLAQTIIEHGGWVSTKFICTKK